MELDLNFLAPPQAFGGFGPESHWRIMELPHLEAKASPAGLAGAGDDCRSAEACCQVA